MPSSDPFIRPKRRVTSGSQSSQSNDTASPSMELASKKRPASGGQSDDMAASAPKRAASGAQFSNSNNMITPAPKRVASGGQSSNSNSIIASAPNRATSGTQSSNSNNMTTPASKRAASDGHAVNLNNIIAPASKRVASDSQPFSPDAAKKLWVIFVRNEAHILPILNLEQLNVDFAVATNHGKLGPTVIDPTFGLCIAIACHLTGDKGLWEGRKWYDAALSNIGDPFNSRPSFQWFHHQILQVHYLHMVGHLKMAWDILSMAIGRAQSLRMQTMDGGSLAVDEESLEQGRLVWQCLWTKKLSLTLQIGVVDQSLDSFYTSPMPMQSHIIDNMGELRLQTIAPYPVTPSFFIACASLFKHTDDLITVENDLRATRMECPIKWLSIVDLSGFQDLNEKLSSWKNGLPKCLQWTGHGIDSTMKKDLVVRRMCVLAHVRFVYFRLRQYRPFFILSLRLSQNCACETSPHLTPHLTERDIDSMDASPVLGLVYYSAVKCLTAAQDIVKTLNASYANMKNEHAKCELLEYLYAAAMILIAARTVPLVMNGGTARGIPVTPIKARSLTTMTEQLSGIDILLRNYQESCDQAPKLRKRIERSRAVIDYLTLQSASCDGIPTDSEMKFKPVVWGRIYGRLGIDLPFATFPDHPRPGGSVVSGRRKTLGWLESLSADHDN